MKCSAECYCLNLIVTGDFRSTALKQREDDRENREMVRQVRWNIVLFYQDKLCRVGWCSPGLYNKLKKDSKPDFLL